MSAHSDLAFDVLLHRSGQVIRVEATQTVVEALAAHDVMIPVSCQQGVCGTCLTRVLEGVVEHRDFFLMPEEQQANDQFLPCCSRAKGPRLVIDL
jgi:vanillate monooxygenase ferredoxin subunit